MTTLVVGASGATGRLLVEELLKNGEVVRAVVRSRDSLPESIRNNENVSVVEASILDLSDAEMETLTQGCSAVASCLGHNLTLKGVFGNPRRLVTDAARRLSKAIEANKPETPVKFVLMNTIANRNRDLNERNSFAEKWLISVLRLLLPPHVDNEKAADFLRIKVGQNNPLIKWVAVRPVGLIDENEVTEYKISQSSRPVAIFNGGTISRLNVANFMAALIHDDGLWAKWQGQMPVISGKVQP